MDLELRKLVATEQIKRLKYAYLRTLDLKRWDEMAELFTDDVATDYGDGKYAFAGKAAVLDFLRRSLGDPGIVSVHQVHHPEISVDDDLEHAVGVFYLQDTVINTGVGPMRGTAGFTLHGTAFYRDAYVKQDGRWRIRHIGYERVYEEVLGRGALEVLGWKSRFAARRDPPAGDS